MQKGKKVVLCCDKTKTIKKSTKHFSFNFIDQLYNIYTFQDDIFVAMSMKDLAFNE